MKRAQREERALSQLLKVARSRADDLRGHLANLEAAKLSAEASIASLAAAVSAEERGGAGGAAAVIDFGRFLQGAEEKRRALEKTRETLKAQIASVRADLHDAFAEIKKLEHVTETGRRAAALAAHQEETALAADLTSMRRRG